MTKLFTSRLGLVKPQPATGEPVLVEDLNDNSEILDKWAGAIWVNPGVTPSTAELFDGAIVAERTSGKVWLAQKNGGGTFDKRWIRFPWQFTGFTASTAQSNGIWQERGIQNFGGGSLIGAGPVNSSAADLVATRVVVPIKGIYSVRFHIDFASNNNNTRAACINFNASPAALDNNTGFVTAAAQSAQTMFSVVCQELLPAGTELALNLFQNSGGSLNVGFQVFITLIAPVN